MIYAEPIIMYEVNYPQCSIQLILYRKDLDHTIICENCSLKLQVSPPVEEICELIYDRTG